MLEEELVFLVREPLQQPVIEGGCHSSQRLGDVLSLRSQTKANDTVIRPVVDAFDQAMLFQSFDDTGRN